MVTCFFVVRYYIRMKKNFSSSCNFNDLHNGDGMEEWNLRLKDILGPAILERLSSSQRYKHVLLLWEMIILGHYVNCPL